MRFVCAPRGCFDVMSSLLWMCFVVQYVSDRGDSNSVMQSFVDYRRVRFCFLLCFFFVGRRSLRWWIINFTHDRMRRHKQHCGEYCLLPCKKLETLLIECHTDCLDVGIDDGVCVVWAPIVAALL